jgi:hypothetical protein
MLLAEISIGDIADAAFKIVNAIVAVVTAALILRIRRIEVRQKTLDVRERFVHSDRAMNVVVEPRVYRDSETNSTILETRIKLTNLSTSVWALPAVYVYARLLPRQGEFRVTENDFSHLPTAEGLSTPYNVAHFDDTLFEMAPNEDDVLYRADRVSCLTQRYCSGFSIAAACGGSRLSRPAIGISLAVGSDARRLRIVGRSIPSSRRATAMMSSTLAHAAFDPAGESQI